MVLRKIGGQNIKFPIFCPKVFAQIGDVHDTLRDRCIVVEMQRTVAGNRAEYVWQGAKERGNEIASEIASAVLEYRDNIRDAYLNYHNLYPSLDFLRDRDREIWKPLFALARVFAPSRVPELERSAIDIATLKTRPVRIFQNLKGEEEKARKLEYAERLLRDALGVVGDCDRITTADLVTRTSQTWTRPWKASTSASSRSFGSMTSSSSTTPSLPVVSGSRMLGGYGSSLKSGAICSPVPSVAESLNLAGNMQQPCSALAATVQ